MPKEKSPRHSSQTNNHLWAPDYGSDNTKPPCEPGLQENHN